MSYHFLRLFNRFTICNPTKSTLSSRYRLTSATGAHRFRHLGHDRHFQMERCIPVLKVTGIPKSFQATYCIQSTPENKKDQTENILTVPNVLTVGRMIMCPFLGYLVINNDYSTAFGLFVVAGITDLVTLSTLSIFKK